MAKKSVAEEQQIPDSTTPPPVQESSQESPVVPQEPPQPSAVAIKSALIRVPYMELPLTGYISDRVDGGFVSEKAAKNAKKMAIALECIDARLEDGRRAVGMTGVVSYLLENVQFEE